MPNPFIIKPLDWQMNQRNYAMPLIVKGILGRGFVDPKEYEKFHKITDQDPSEAPPQTALDKMLEYDLKDGLYSDEKALTKGHSYNIQRYEQRLLREHHREWFNRASLELRTNYDLVESSISKPLDISSEIDPAMDTVVIGAVHSERINV